MSAPTKREVEEWLAGLSRGVATTGFAPRIAEAYLNLAEVAREAYMFVHIASITHGADSPRLREKLLSAIPPLDKQPGLPLETT